MDEAQIDRKQQKMDRWVKATLEKRSLWLDSETTFYLHLVKGERGACPWQLTGYSSFDEVLRRHQIADALRYRRLAGALEVVADGEKVAEAIGVDAVILAANIAASDLRGQFVAKVQELAAARPKGAPLTLDELRKLKRAIDPKVQATRATNRPKTVSVPEDLQTELERLVEDLRKTGTHEQASKLVHRFIRQGIAAMRNDMLLRANRKEKAA